MHSRRLFDPAMLLVVAIGCGKPNAPKGVNAPSSVVTGEPAAAPALSAEDANAPAFVQADGLMREMLTELGAYATDVEAKKGDCPAIATVIKAHAPRATELQTQMQALGPKLNEAQQQELERRHIPGLQAVGDRIGPVVAPCADHPDVKAAQQPAA